MRQPIGRDTYYASTEPALRKQLEELYLHQRGPGAQPTRQESKSSQAIQGVIVPHGPYHLAGPCMAWSYKALAEHKKEDKLYIIIAQAQHSTQAGTCLETFKMPFGEVRVDQDFVKALVFKESIALNQQVHNSEEVIEIQLPFLQDIHGIYREQIKIVPLLVNGETDLKTLSLDIKETLLEQHKEAQYIFVSNFTSYGREFRYVPFTEHVVENIGVLDKAFFDALAQHDKEAFDEPITQHLVPLSGLFPLQLSFFLLQPRDVDLEQNYLSADMNGNFTNMISYASIVFR